MGKKKLSISEQLLCLVFFNGSGCWLTFEGSVVDTYMRWKAGQVSILSIVMKLFSMDFCVGEISKNLWCIV